MQNAKKRQSFDFDLMAKLAKESPAEFARLRAILIDQAIGSFSDAVDGGELQGEIDLERVCCGHGAEASVALTKRLYGLVQQMNRLASELEREVCK